MGNNIEALYKIPEISEDADTLITDNGLPEFNDISIEKCIATISKQSMEYENGVGQIEQCAPNCKNAFVEIFQPLEKLDSQLELTWGISKALYLGNSTLMPTKSYIQIHERAHKARSAKFNSAQIYHAAVNEKNRLKKLTDEEQRLLDKYILEGKLNGIDVKGIKKDRLANILNSMQKDRQLFREKVNVANKRSTTTVNAGYLLKECPESLLKAMAAPNDPNRGPWKVTLQPHIYEPFMQYCSDRELRCETWQAYTQRCSNYINNELETGSNLEEIWAYRQEQANLLGYETYVDMIMKTKMAGSLENVNGSNLENIRAFRQEQEQANILGYKTYVDMSMETIMARSLKNVNDSNLENIRAYRQEQANILGYETYVDMIMETKMAGSLENVNNVLDSLLESARSMQDAEVELLQRFAQERGFSATLEHWDIPYWQRKHKYSQYGFDENKIREYFPLPRVMTSLFNLCSSLFKIEIVEKAGVNTWHKDVKFYDVFDDSSNTPIAGFYFDPYARQDQKIRVYDDAGWHIAMRNKCTTTSTNPLSALIFNFQAPVEGKPTLLSFKEVGFLFQRFGHSLPHLLTKANYSEVAGLSNVEWDAAEVCGQVMTHWLYDPYTIRAISGHYSTDDPLPEYILNNLQNIRSHMAGYDLCQELYLSRLDLDLHSRKEFWRDIVRELWPKYHTLAFNKYDSHPLSFTQIMSEEWGAAYYCHLWSKMIAADIYSAFDEARKADQDVLEVGKRFRDTFLASGGSCSPSEVFRRFRGRDPSPHALLKNLGLPKAIEKLN